ncbi:MAG TPA: DUF1592 domain-containing protein [Deltaproteobacteria bacterium]|nr:DUF1592 domain-containing protein [Deltaproteobacteria bacterium]
MSTHPEGLSPPWRPQRAPADVLWISTSGSAPEGIAALALAVLLSGCAGPSPEPGPVIEPLTPLEHLSRASLAVRGIRPSLDEIETIFVDPGALPRLVDTWLEGPEFGDTVEDLHAELFLLRADTNHQLPVKGILQERGYDQADVHFSTVEAPLRFVREVILEDRPYTEILTADYTVANEVVAAIYGLPFDPRGPEWQHTEWVDGRPQSGLLSDSEMWRRHVSNAANFHRGRANFVSQAFLCEDIGARDVFVAGGVDIADELAVAEAVSTQEGCVACHNALDPLAAFFWGYKEQLQRGAVLEAYELGCEWRWDNGPPPRGSYRVEHWCYPLKFYDVSEEGLWEDWHLRPPGYFGQPASDMRELGALIASDARFAECTVRNFAGYLTQTERSTLPREWIDPLTRRFVSTSFDARELVRDIVLSSEFSTARITGGDAFAPGLQTLRPEQLARTLWDLTGFRWMADQDPAGCAQGTNTCWGAVDLLGTDLYGVRSMMGGIDGYTVTHPTHTPTPTQQLALQIVAQEAAGFVVGSDLQLPREQRRLLDQIEAGEAEEGRVRLQLARLHLRILGEHVAAWGPQVDLTYGLWAGAFAHSGDPAEGWRVAIAALLQDPHMVLY